MNAKSSDSIDSTELKTYTPSRSSAQKRELTSPEFPTDLKKNKPYLSSQSECDQSDQSDQSDTDMSATGQEMDVGGTGAVSRADADAEQLGQQPNVNITLRDADIARISEVLKGSFRGELHGEMSEMVKTIVDGVVSGLRDQIQAIREENVALRRENDSLKIRMQKLESAADNAEQYSRRNCLRISGVRENNNENTDELILEMTRSMDVDLSLQEIDRSHRVGKPNPARARDIIVKLSTFRSREKLYRARRQLKDTGHAGVYINEDLTKFRSSLLYTGRKLVKARRILGAWSTNGTILIKDNDNIVHRIVKPDDLTPYETAPPRPES